MTALAFRHAGVDRRPFRMNRCEHCGNMVMNSASAPLHLIALQRLARDLGGCSADCWRFFELLFPDDPHFSTLNKLFAPVGVGISTLQSRFLRSRLPSANRYFKAAIFVHAAQLLETPGRTVYDVANTLGFSCPQHFGRSCRNYTGMLPTELRRYSGLEMFERFRAELVLPFVPQLLDFLPFTDHPHGRRRA